MKGLDGRHQSLTHQRRLGLNRFYSILILVLTALASIAIPSEGRSEVPTYHFFQFFADYQFTTLSISDDATQTSADLYTSHDIETGLSWSQRWNDQISSFATFSLRNLDFEPSSNAEKTLTYTSQILGKFRLGTLYQLDTNAAIRGVFLYKSELFVRGLTTDSISIEAIALPQLALEGDFEFFRKNKTALGLTGQLIGLAGAAPAGYTISTGGVIGATVYVRQDLDNGALVMQFGYRERNQKTTISTFKESNIYSTLTWALPVFK
jgi:hypothetical protein